MRNQQEIDDAAIEAADDAEARRTGGTFAAKYLGPLDGWDGKTMPSPAATTTRPNRPAVEHG